MSCKIGDYIIYRPAFGMEDPVIAKVTGLTLTTLPRDKYGTDVTQIDWYCVKENKVVFSLDNSHWCYSDQVQTSWSPEELREILESPLEELPTHLGRHCAIDAWIAMRLKEGVCPLQKVPSRT